jgi:Tetratricopeptide repeat
MNAASNPFPGLRPFETEEYRLFFGREGQSDALIERLSRSRLLAVVGTSGSGKSSLVRAGLLPALRGGMMAGAGAGWRIAVMRPGHDPLGNLARALAEEGVLAEAGGGLPQAEAEAVIEATLRRGSLGLVEAAAHARLSEREQLLVVVDQFEELFRFRAARDAASTDDDASAFVKLLLEAARQRELSIYVVITMRSDFLGDCAQFQGLPEAINDGQYLIPRMTRDERRMAVVGPVRVARARMSEPLVNRLLNDVGDNPDQLPILQHALMRTWDYWSAHRRDSEPLGIPDYEAIGTMSDALSRHAEEAFGELPDERSRRVAEALFKSLTERGPDNREIRRPTTLEEICEIAEASEAEVSSVVEVFRREGRSFLMPPAGVALGPDTVIDISHESLIRNWQRLKEWVRDEAEGARIYRRLADAAVAYREGEGGLLDEVTLRWVLRWRERYHPNRAWGVRYHPEYDAAIAYLEESLAARESDAAERERKRREELERERREREQAEAFAAAQARAARRLRRFTFALILISLFALTAAFASAYAFAQARRNAAAAHESEARAEKLADDLKQSLKEATDAKEEAGRQRDAAVAEERRAQNEEKRAEEEQARAEAAEKKAEQASVEARRQAELAQAEAARVKREQQRADQQARVITASQQANENYREGTAAAERKEYKQAADEFNGALQGFNEVLTLGDEGNLFGDESRLREGGGQQVLHRARVLEGEADALVQRARVNFDAWQFYGDIEQNPIERATDYFDQAASLYGGNEVASPNKAAEALFTLATLLTKYADNPARIDATKEDRLRSVLNQIALAPLPWASSYFPVSIDAEKVRRDAAERYRRAFDFYKQASNREGMMDTAMRIGDFYSKSEDPNERRLAVQYFEELRKLVPQGKDAARLFLRLGGLYQGLGEGGKAGEYYELAVRDIAEYQKVGAEVAYTIAGDREGQTPAALSLYEKSLAAAEASGSLAAQGAALFKIGSFHQGAKDDAKAAQFYERSFESFRRAYERAESYDDRIAVSADLDAISSFAVAQNDGRLAREAHDLALAFAVRDTERRYADLVKKGEAGPWWQAAMLGAVGDTYLRGGDEASAMKYYRQSVEAYARALRDFKASPGRKWTPELSTAVLAESLLGIGDTATRKGEYQFALQALSLAADVAGARNSVAHDYGFVQGEAYRRIGRLYYLMNQPEKAIEFSEKGLALPSAAADDDKEKAATRALVLKLKKMLLERQGEAEPPQPTPKP